MQPSTFLFGGACRRPSLKHAGARHNAFAASFTVDRCCSAVVKQRRCRHHQHSTLSDSAPLRTSAFVQAPCATPDGAHPIVLLLLTMIPCSLKAAAPFRA
jgi:hypothetical protein